MKYIKAQNVLPKEMIQMIQDYIDGEYLYIPRKCGEKKTWGEKSGTKNMLMERNIEIYNKFHRGKSVYDLSEEYYLTEQSIRRIISRTKSVIKINSELFVP